MTQSLRSIRFRRLDLSVADVDRSRAWYEEQLGLVGIPAEHAEALHLGRRTMDLGVGQATFLRLHEEPGIAPSPASASGLYHVAFLLPSRSDLATFVRRLVRDQVPIVGASDHGVSEAIYLEDPDGHGVEVYADRPREAWRFHGDVLELRTDPLNLDDLLATPHDANSEAGFPDGTTIGHVHLRVRDASEARAYYQHGVGLDLMTEIPRAAFLSADGYHHHLGVNAWQSSGRTVAQDGVARLMAVHAEVSAADLAPMKARLEDMGSTRPLDHEAGSSPLALEDPSGTRWIVRAHEWRTH